MFGSFPEGFLWGTATAAYQVQLLQNFCCHLSPVKLILDICHYVLNTERIFGSQNLDAKVFLDAQKSQEPTRPGEKIG